MRMRNLDFSSLHALFSTVLGLAMVTLIAVGLRLLVMQTIQQRRERENRQVNERLRTLIAAYKTLGGSFTGNLTVDPTHLADLKKRTPSTAPLDATTTVVDAIASAALDARIGSDRSRRVRDAVEAALSDIILLGTEEQVRLAAAAASELAAGRPTHTAALVVSLRDFIRKVLDLDPISANIAIPAQGPTRTTGGGKGKNEGDEGKRGKTGGGGGGGAGGGMGMGGSHPADEDDHHH